MIQTYYCPVLLAIVLIASSVRAQKIEETLDVPYGDDAGQRLDIYRPKEAKTKLPAVLWIHGGGWTEGDKRKEPNGISALAPVLVENGFVAISCNYRLLPKHSHPAQVDDVQRVVRWLRANAEKYSIDPDRIGAVGISAGGHLACMLGVRKTRAKQDDPLDKFSSKVQAVVVLNGPTDLRPDPELAPPALDRSFRKLVGDDAEKAKQAREDASPLVFVGKDSAPMLFIVGAKDNIVPNGHSTRLADALKQNGVEAEVLKLEDAGHGIFPKSTPAAKDAILKFFRQRLKP